MGKLIIVEGADYVGKTTTVDQLAKLLEEAGYDVRVFREPGGHFHAETIRELLFNAAIDLKRAKKYKALLFYASRDITLQERVMPLLQNENTVVIYDRFNLSTLVYQGLLVDDLKYVIALDELILGDTLNDVEAFKFLLTIPKSEMVARMEKRVEGNSYDPNDIEEAMRRQLAYKALGGTRGYVEIDNTNGGAIKHIYDVVVGG